MLVSSIGYFRNSSYNSNNDISRGQMTLVAQGLCDNQTKHSKKEESLLLKIFNNIKNIYNPAESSEKFDTIA